MKREKSKRKLLKNLPRFVAIVLILLSVFAVLFLMQYVQGLLASDVEINLTEVVTQNRDVINSKLTLEINNLQLAANQIVERMRNEDVAGDEGMDKIFLEYVKEKGDGRLFIAGKDGMALFPDGATTNIAGRNYYRLANGGAQNISDRVISRTTGNEMFAISVPIWENNAIIGTLQKEYTPEEMYEICSVSLFSDQGYMSIINSDGYVVISSRPDAYSQESENYYRTLYAQGDKAASERLEEDVKAGRSGFMETVINGVKTFAAYTPIENAYDWNLISSIPTSAVSPNANIVVNLFYVILLIIVAVVILFTLYFWYFKNKQQTALRNIAFVDPVTGGNTYNKFVVDMQELLHENPEKQYYVLVFDIDNFKYVNSYYGFDRGDRVLQKIVQTIDERLLPNEIVARVSGDHFIVLLEEASEKRLNTLLDSAQENEEVDVYISAGLYRITNPDESVNLMMDKARMAAETTKGVPHKRLEVYSEQFDTQMIRNEQLKRSLEQAMQNGEIIPFYQPKVDVNTRALVGAEALARWRTKEGVLISPGEFIPIAEKTGLITDIDMAIFKQVLRFQKDNLDAGEYCVPISVNFSRIHLANPEFVDMLIATVMEYGVPPQLIELELTESVFFDNYELITKLILQLHDDGFLTSIDDFGSGYSSLNMLKDIPVDIIKLDRQFLRGSTNSEKQRIIFATIAQMAQRLHIGIVVEGVESEAHVALMKEYGCYVAQGFYFAKPMDEQAFENVFREGKV